MKLENFDLNKPFGAIELQGLGHDWDLHNWAEFKGFSFVPGTNELILEWRVPEGHENPWGSRGNMARGCRLRFQGLKSIRVSERDTAYPLKESDCVSGISKVIPGELEYPFKRSWAEGEAFHLRITFQDERNIEIAAESVSLEAIV
jgi:hypothetical protein